MKRLAISLIALLGCAAFDWSDVRRPAAGPTQSIGFYSAGCIRGAQPLPFDGLGFEAIRIRRNRYWGQPVTLRFIEELGARMHAAGQAPLLIGDIGQPRGGPAPTGHASHQNGLDADIWFERDPGPRLPPPDREHPRLRPLVRDDISIDDTVFGPQHVQLLKAAAEMPHLDRLFVNRWIKARLCHTVTGDRHWLRKIVPWYGHDAHFHVRLRCPPDNPQCRPQADYAHDDGCGAALDWWLKQPPVVFPAEDVPPNKPYRPKLPAACAAVLNAPSEDLPVKITGK
ncbi:penicillin-insensitive murein endopeptidase [Enhydrobacter sp.]|jgi:penicillin-insensitive murein endopeptidase|uniref:penicillin-insensitive murein endopeptidase n=1 Tax=Enhydrobacter sp. TaxID=1894999 RepID=UPI0026375BE8|nr:penicillin-insensitive murein endopeptidase [Enhydrobacter sp.]WIM13621.1 MAG: Penicillin-insensitive murein endopeptidase [Enhydrobacter sp.]